MPNFDDFIDILKEDLVDLAKDHGEDLKNDFLEDGEAFAKRMREDLEEWTEEVAKGELTQDELMWLLEAKKDLARMEALKQKGIAKAKIDKFRSALVETVAGSVYKVIQ